MTRKKKNRKKNPHNPLIFSTIFINGKKKQPLNVVHHLYKYTDEKELGDNVTP